MRRLVSQLEGKRLQLSTQRCAQALASLGAGLHDARISTSAAAEAGPSSSNSSIKREAGTVLRFYKNAGIQHHPEEVRLQQHRVDL